MFRVTAVVCIVAAAIAVYAIAQAEPAPREARDHGLTPLHALTPELLDEHLRFLAANEPSAAARLRKLAEQAQGQPHQPDCLGDGTYDPSDPRPLYRLDASDSRSFVEQTLAMSVSDNFERFFLTLQRLRYKDGQISTATRHRNLLADWARHNSWLLEDITKQLAEEMAWVPLHQLVYKRGLLLDRYGIHLDVPDEKFIDAFIPRVYLYKVLPELHEGDIVMVITGDNRQQYCEEMGIMARDPQDQAEPLRMIMSMQPVVAKMGFRAETRRRTEIRGYKFLRLRPSAATAAAQEAAEMAQNVQAPPLP